MCPNGNVPVGVHTLSHYEYGRCFDGLLSSIALIRVYCCCCDFAIYIAGVVNVAMSVVVTVKYWCELYRYFCEC